MTQTVLLGDIATIKGGKRLPKGDILREAKNSHPYLRIVDMGEKFIKKANLQYVPDDVFPKISRYITNTNDILLSIVGTIGLVAIVDEELDNASLTENCVKLTCNPEKFDSEFVYYFLSSSVGQAEIHAGRVGSTQPKLPLYNIAKIRIPNLSLSEQKKIADILGTIDEKIELNRKTNKILEQIGQALFRHNFVGRQDVKHSLTIGDIANVIDCLHSKKPERVIEDTGHILLQLNNIKNDGTLDLTDKYFVSDEDYIKWTSRLEAIENDFVITNVGRSGAVAKIPHSVKAALGRNMTGIRLRPGYETPGFLSFLLNSDYMKKQIESKLDHGTILSALNVKNIPKLPIPADDIEHIKQHEKEFFDLRKKIEMNVNEIQTLTTLRDTLLSRLISGKIEIDGAG